MDDSVTMAILFLGAIFAIVAFWSSRRNRDFEVIAETTASINAVTEYIISTYNSKGFITSSSVGSTTTLHRKREINYVLLILLALVGVIPALFYLAIGGKDLVVSIVIKNLANGNTGIEISGNAIGHGNGALAYGVIQKLPGAKWKFSTG